MTIIGVLKLSPSLACGGLYAHRGEAMDQDNVASSRGPRFAMAARIAMACRFEVIAIDDGHDDIHAALERALDEVEQLEMQLSPFIDGSHLSDINRRAHHEPVKVEPQLYWLIRRAVQIGIETQGAFDITIGALTIPIKLANRFAVETQLGARSEIDDAKPPIGLRWLQLDDEAMTVRFLQHGMMLDLCGIAKGYAVDVVSTRLLEEGVRNFFVHAGKSSIYAAGTQPNFNGWVIGVTDPTKPSRRLATIELKGMAMGVSERHGSFACGRRLHILDPRAYPDTAEGICGGGERVIRAYAICSSATEADALSTAFLLLGCDGVKKYCESHEGVGAMLITQSDDGVHVITYGLDGGLSCRYHATAR